MFVDPSTVWKVSGYIKELTNYIILQTKGQKLPVEGSQFQEENNCGIKASGQHHSSQQRSQPESVHGPANRKVLGRLRDWWGKR